MIEQEVVNRKKVMSAVGVYLPENFDTFVVNVMETANWLENNNNTIINISYASEDIAVITYRKDEKHE